ncbi:MAG: methyltransferase [Acidimicrobiia bacterium]|nr:methyltransferase [Acidimicrobiia bacterium]
MGSSSSALHRGSVLLLFVGSGVAALVYEVVWFQMLQFVVGSSSVSMGMLLATFMGGSCIGSVWFARLVSVRHHPLRVYAVLEAAIGACALLLLVFVPLIGRLYTAWAGAGPSGFLLRGVVAAACLLPPTVAMGATLPAIGRWVEMTPRGLSWLGFFYAGNTIGAVIGCLLAGFYLLRLHDVVVATIVAASVNGVVSVVAWTLAARDEESARRGVVSGSAAQPGGRGERWRRVAPLAAIPLSGYCALSAEVVWTRYLALSFGATVYSFGIILAVFLGGLGIGSALGAVLAARLRRPAVGLGVAQLLTIPAIWYSGVMLARVLPTLAPTVSITTTVWQVFAVDVSRAVVAVLPGPLLWGASFPLALASSGGADHDGGRLVGRVYAANALGAIVGALASSLVLIGAAGSQVTQQLMIGVAAVAAIVALMETGRVGERRAESRALEREPRRFRSLVARRAALATAVGGIAVFAILNVPAVPALLVAYGRHAAAWAGHAGDVFFVGEGLQASVAVSRQADGSLNYHNAGKIQASSLPQDMRLQRMLGHLTTIVPKEARSVLVIGCGAGVTAGAVSVSPKVERVTIAEIEPLVPAVVSRHFAAVNHDVLRNPKVRVHIDDARHFLATTDEQFDAITSDPLDPWVKGAAALYTKEFFELAKSRLKPGGVMTLFVQLYESSPEAVKSEIATFFEAFPHGLIFGNTFDGRAEDTVLVGATEPLSVDVDALEAAHLEEAHALARRSLGEIGIYSVVDLLGRYAGRAADLKPWLADAVVTRDRDLRLQYLAGLGLNQHLGRDIYRQILEYRRYPDDVFMAREPHASWLREAIGQGAE